MAVGISFRFLVLVMMSGGMLRQVNEAPPRDLASLVPEEKPEAKPTTAPRKFGKGKITQATLLEMGGDY